MLAVDNWRHPLMTTATPLLLITKDPNHPLAVHALRYAQAMLAKHQQDHTDDHAPALNLFFYGEAAHIANRLRWQSADQLNLTKAWQDLAQEYGIALPVCVSTALARGISDTDNSTRHQLQGDNLAEGFGLVGLSELALMMQGNNRVLQF